jgi:hypothetical protein
MNSAQALAGLSLLLLVVTLFADRLMGTVDLPVFEAQLRNYTMYGVSTWFQDPAGKGVGRARTRVVLRMAMLSASARTTLVAHLVAIVGLAVTGAIVARAHPAYAGLRIGLDAASLVAVVAGMVALLVHLVRGTLRPVPIVAATATRTERLRGFLGRHRDPDYLTGYATLTLLANMIVILTSLGI